MIGFITLPLKDVDWNPNQPTILWREFEPKSQVKCYKPNIDSTSVLVASLESLI